MRDRKKIIIVVSLLIMVSWTVHSQDTIIKYFTGNAASRHWAKKAPVADDFFYRVFPDSLVMKDANNHNQHLIRRNITIDPLSAYAVEVHFKILEPVRKSGCCNSFGLLFNIADTNVHVPVSAMKIGLNLNKKGGGDINVMGYNNGKYNIRATIKAPWASINTEYKLLVLVNASLNGKHKDNLVTLTFMNNNNIMEQAQVDYAGYPYQVDKTNNVGIGLNAHGANWVVKKLKVWYIKP